MSMMRNPKVEESTQEFENEMLEKYPPMFAQVDSEDRILLRGEGCKIRENYVSLCDVK